MEICEHPNVIEYDKTNVCENCGEEIEILTHEAEWKWYSPGDKSRCHKFKTSVSNAVDRCVIRKVFDDRRIQISDSLYSHIEDRYNAVTSDDVVRGKKRTSIIAACMMYIYRELGDVREAKEFQDLFGLTKQEMSDGISEYCKKFPNERTSDVNPCDLIRRTLTRIQASESFIDKHFDAIVDLSKKLRNINTELNHSSPNSVAPAIVYVYLSLIPKTKRKMGMTKAKFASIVKLSEITITKLSKIIGKELHCKIID